MHRKALDGPAGEVLASKRGSFVICCLRPPDLRVRYTCDRTLLSVRIKSLCWQHYSSLCSVWNLPQPLRFRLRSHGMLRSLSNLHFSPISLLKRSIQNRIRTFLILLRSSSIYPVRSQWRALINGQSREFYDWKISMQRSRWLWRTHPDKLASVLTNSGVSITRY